MLKGFLTEPNLIEFAESESPSLCVLTQMNGSVRLIVKHRLVVCKLRVDFLRFS